MKNTEEKLGKSTRKAYGQTLANIGSDENIFVFDADVSSSTQTSIFAKKYPERFFNVGISEQDMIGQAAGSALMGKTSFASAFAVFLVGRAYDQIRQSIGYNHANVKLVSTHSGLTAAYDGATHQMLEDIGMMNAIPGMDIYTASTPKVTKHVIEDVAYTQNPTYVRLYRNDTDELYEKIDEESLKQHVQTGIIGKGVPKVSLKDHQVLLITCGDMTKVAYQVQEYLKHFKIHVLVLDVIRIKPFNTTYLIQVLNTIPKIKVVTLEDHNVTSGIGSIVSNITASMYPKKIKKIGMKEFGRSGSYDELLWYYKLDAKSVAKNILSMFKDNPTKEISKEQAQEIAKKIDRKTR